MGPPDRRANQGICGTDVHIYHGALDGRVKIPQVIGHETSGTVAELGQGVEGLSAGDRVITAGIQKLSPGVKVKELKVKSSQAE